jgi:hypothetical protein
MLMNLSNFLDYLRHYGHVWPNSLPHENMPSLDHDTSIQPLPEMRYIHQNLPGDHAGLLHPSCHCQSPHLQPSG